VGYNSVANNMGLSSFV